MDALLDKVRQTILSRRMFEPGDKVVTAVSGGADSTALLCMLAELRQGLGISLCVAHLNHMARGEESREDAEFVSRLARDLGLESHVEAIDVKKEKAALKTSFQEAGRTLRYRFLESVRNKTGGTRIALGHNADDQVETVLMNLLRGSGLKGLGGMPPVRGRIVRPLLECRRSEIEAFLKERGIPYRSDRSNAGREYLRNRLRLDLVPLLENAYNNNLKTNVLEMTRILQDENDCLEELARRYFEDYSLAAGGEGEVVLKTDGFTELHPAIQRRLARRAIRAVKGDLRRISARHVRDAVAMFEDFRYGKRVHLPDGLVVERRGGAVSFYVNPTRRSGILWKEPARGESAELNIPGVTEIADVALRFNARLTAKKDEEFRSAPASQAFLDFDKTGGRVVVRFARPGDRFVPLGMDGAKKLKSFFIDEKIPREKRRSIPILTTQEDDIIWVYGRRISQNYRVTPDTKNVLLIEGKPV
ncbi:MAG: tRNA lysidine(34) synthetase TilS [Nitrospinae bacterium]|nr:tRNA lysidine(34) synthetase TilS [Nitrospinota bacterium]